MVSFERPSANELEARMKEQIAELEKANQELRAEILEHKRAEEALRESENLFRTVIENSHDGISMLDLKTGRYVLMSPSQVEMTSYTAEEINSISAEEAYELVHPDDREISITQQRLIAAGLDIASTVEYRWKIKSGEYRWLSDSRKLVRDSKGNPIALVGISRDITERKKTEESLRQSEERYKTLFNSIAEGFCIIEMIFDVSGKPIDYRFLETNPTFERQTGLHGAEGKTMRELVPTHEEHWFEIYGNIVLTGESRRFTNEAKPLMGGWYDIYAFQFGGRESNKVAVIFNDITERKETEIKLKETLGNLENLVKERTVKLQESYNSLKESEQGLAEAQRIAHIGNWEWNIATGESHWSDEMYRIFGLNPQELSPTHDRFLNYIHPNDREHIESVIKKALSEKPFGIDYRIITANGEERIVHAESEVTFDLNNNPVRAKGIIQDITERKQIENALQESETRFRNLFEVISSGVAIYDVIGDGRDFIFKDINPAGERIDHVQRKDIIGKSLYQFFPNVSEMGLDAAFRRVWLSGRPEAFPVTFYRDENIALWVTNYIYRLPSGELVAVFDDITIYKQAEEERKRLLDTIQQEKDRLSALIDSITDEIWFVDTQKNFALVNPSVISKFNLSFEKSMMAREFFKDLEIRYPDGSLRPIEKSPALRALQGEVVKNEEEIVRVPFNGKLRYRQVNAAPVLDTKGNIIGSVSVVRDITEQKKAEERLRESEEKYRNIVETANEGILIIDDKAIITYVNRKIADMLGYTQEEGIGRPIWDFLDEESKAIVKLNFENRQHDINQSYELKLMRKDGLPIWVIINAKALFDKDGKYMGSLSMLTDITERKESEKALEKIEEIRIKEIHHRIKNNLQVISSLLSLEAEKFSDRKMLDAFQESQNRVASMALIHEELYSGKDTDALDFAVYLRKLTADLLNSYNVGNDKISLKLDLEQAQLDMDTSIPLGIIVNELVSNALKHAFPYGMTGEIQIALKRAENFTIYEEDFEAKDRCREKGNFDYALTVADDGIGIPEEIDLQTADSLGLQLVNVLVEQIDGCIELGRKPGTEFTIWFNIEK